MYFNFKGWKKVSTDKKHVVMQNHEGHELKIALSSLSPKMRGRLAELETAKDEDGKPQSMAMGGVVMETGNKADDAEQRRRRNANPDIGTQAKKGGSDHPKEKDPTRLGDVIGYKGMADGGEVKKKKTLGETIGYPGFAHGGEQEEPAATPIIDPMDPRSFGGDAAVDAQKSAEAQAYGQANAPAAPQMQEVLTALPEAPALPAASPSQGPAPASVLSSNAGIAPASTSSTATDAASKALGMPTAEQMMAQGYQSQLSGVNALANAEAKLGEAKQKALVDQQAYDQAAIKESQTKFSELENENKALIADYKNGQVDPNHFWNSKSTPGKISTVIGLLLGGIGQGLMGKGPNMAMEFLQKNIDADIDAQKANIAKGHNLLSFNMQRFGNLKDAINMTRAQQMQFTEDKLQEAAAVAQGPEAKARALMAAGQLKAQYTPILQKQALESTITKLKGEVEKDPSKAGLLFDAVSKVDPEKAKDLRDRFVPGINKFANTSADAKDLKEGAAATGVINTGIKRLIDINKISGKSMDPSLIAEANAITTGLKGPFRTALGLGTLSEGDMKLLDNLLRNPTNFFSLGSSNKKALETVLKRTNDNFASAVKSKGLSMPDAASSLTPQQQSFVKWARANPNNPKSKILLEKLGISE